MNDPRSRQAYLLALQGSSVAEIAERLGAERELVDAWLETESRAARNLAAAAPPRPEISLRERVWAAKESLSRPDFIHFAIGDDLLGDSDAGIGLWDGIAHDLSDLADESLELIAAFPNVISVAREDRDFIAIYGVSIDLAELEAALRAWWRIRLEEIVREDPDLTAPR